MRPLPRAIHAVGQILAAPVAAIPRVWASDRMFRIAVLAAGIALVTLLVPPVVEGNDTRTPSQVTSRPSSLPPPGARYAAPGPLPQADADPAARTSSGPMVPGQALDGLRIDLDPDAFIDRFGTRSAVNPGSGRTP